MWWACRSCARDEVPNDSTPLGPRAADRQASFLKGTPPCLGSRSDSAKLSFVGIGPTLTTRCRPYGPRPRWPTPGPANTGDKLRSGARVHAANRRGHSAAPPAAAPLAARGLVPPKASSASSPCSTANHAVRLSRSCLRASSVCRSNATSGVAPTPARRSAQLASETGHAVEVRIRPPAAP
jgi:hypothetical protein